MNKERYNSFNSHLKKVFGEKVYKIPLDPHFSCPNKDGQISKKGCIFCDKYGSGPIKTRNLSIKEQIETGIERVKKKYKAKKFIAYFQAHTNTNASKEKLQKIFNLALSYKEIVGISIWTRPDWIFKEHLELLEKLNKQTYLWVELGIQSIHHKSLAFLRRNHGVSDFLKTTIELQKRGIRVCAHTIIGIPDEKEDEIIETARFLSALGVKGVKIHLLHILKNTDLETLYREGRIKLLSLNEYVSFVVEFLEHLKEDIIIQRLTGERDKEIFIAPQWALNKGKVLEKIREELIKRNTYQGKKAKFSVEKSYEKI